MNPAVSKTPDASKPEAAKAEALKPDAAKPEPSKSIPRSTMPMIPRFKPYVNENSTSVAIRMLLERLKMDNEHTAVKALPSKLISDTLITIHAFLFDEARHKLVFVPNSYADLHFYRISFSWCLSTYVVTKYGEEFQEIHIQISSLLSRVNFTVHRATSFKVNATTGIREASFIKPLENVPKVSTPEPAKRVRKKKKVNLQKALQSAGSENIKLETVINLNQSLRSKKKHKKQKKAKLKARKEETVKPQNQARPNYTWTDASSSACSSRGNSRDRSQAGAKIKFLPKAPLNEINQGSKNTFQEPWRSRRGEETIRKEQLIEAMSVPVQSDRAMRMMRGMGWSGGALGAKGNGITEPLMPSLDVARGAGFGHSRNAQLGKNATRKLKTGKAATDDPTSDTIMKTVEPQKPKESNFELPTQTISNVELQKSRESIDDLEQRKVELTTQTKTGVELLEPLKANVELSKPVPRFSVDKKGNLKFHQLNRRLQVLHGIFELLNSDATLKILKFDSKVKYQERKFVKIAPMELKSGQNSNLFHGDEHIICRKIKDLFMQMPEVVIEAYVAFDSKGVELKKTMQSDLVPTRQEISIITHLSLHQEKPLEEKVHSYIISSGTVINSATAYGKLKFKLQFLLNTLSFIQSSDEEVDVTFNKVLNVSEKNYIQNVVDGVNMRITFGSSPGETELSEAIKNVIQDAFLGAMLNHQYKGVTLNKYYRCKLFNRPLDKSTSQTTVNVGSSSTKTSSETKLNTNDPTVKTAENNNQDVGCNSKLVELHKKAKKYSAYVAYKNNAVTLPDVPEVDESDHNISGSSTDEQNNKNCTVPKLPPEKDFTIISNLVHLYDEVAKDTAGIENRSNINNDSAFKNNSNVTENNNKNNVGNGNVVIDNNDNQVIDMKRGGDNTKNTEKEYNIVDTEMVEYVKCVDYTEEKLNTGEITVDINNEKQGNITENLIGGEECYEPIDQSDIDVEIVDEENSLDITKMIDEILSNVDTIDQNVLVTEVANSNDCTEPIVKDEIQNGDNPATNDKDIKGDTDIIINEIDDEPMEVMSISGALIEVMDEEGSVELFNQGESIEETNKVDSSKNVVVAKMEVEYSINPSDNQKLKVDLEMKADGDKISKEKLVLSEDICDTHAVGLSHVKSVGTETDVPNVHINKDTEIKTVRIVHTNHPTEELNKGNIKEIQRHISNSIVLSAQLPLLKCHGIQNGALIYSCHNKKTYDWLQHIINGVSYVKVLNTDITKMALKLYSFFDFDTKHLFNMIELYNQELSTKDWVVEKTKKDDDNVVLIVKMDKFSIKFIQESDLALFAGIDKVQFTLVWE